MTQQVPQFEDFILSMIRQDFIDGLDGAELNEEDHIFVVSCMEQAVANARKRIIVRLER